MELIPDRFQCQDDRTDLTDLVTEQLEEEITVPVMFRPRRLKPFRVLVTCPGVVGGHEVTCTGQVRS